MGGLSRRSSLDPPLKDEVHGLLNPKKNPWFEHARAQLWLAERDGKLVGRISAQVDDLVLEQMGQGTGQWGMFEALDAEAAAGADRDCGGLAPRARHDPFARAVQPVDLGRARPGDRGLRRTADGDDGTPSARVSRSGSKPPVTRKAKDLLTYEVDITNWQDPTISRLIAMGEKNSRIRIRKVDKSRFDEEARVILGLLNDAWSDNWGFVPLTESEIAYAGKKLKPIIYEELVRIAEYDGEPVAFMITIPDVNALIKDLNGELFPFNWAKLLWRLRKPRTERARVPLMGVAKRFHGSRLASQLAFMLIEFTRRDAVGTYGIKTGEFGWILEDNKGMLSIAELPGARINHRFRIYEKAL